MSKQSTVIRASGKLLDEVDAYKRHIERETGVRIDRSAAAHALLRLGLRAAARKEKKP